jgi:hypothetical protein
MTKWRLYSYDVWGNAKDGYEVNDVFRTNEIVSLPNVVLNNEEAIITYLIRIGFFKKGIKRNLIVLDGDENVIYFSYEDRPDFELRKEG